MGKETRRERFEKYRREIRNTPDDKFPNSSSKMIVGGDRNSLSLADRPSFALTYGDALSNLSDIAAGTSKKGKSPYKTYLQKKKNHFVIKVTLLIVTVILMMIWFVLLQKRG